MEYKRYNYLMPLVLSMILIAGMYLGFRLRETSWNKPPIQSENAVGKLDEILNLIQVKYVDSVDAKSILNKALDQFLTDLDPHSFYIPQSELKWVKESLEGKFEGIGIEFYIVKDTIVVVTPISGGPSEALGIISGDKIIRINDTLVAGVGITNNEVVRKLRGSKGTQVKVSIQRNHQPELLEFLIVRDQIPLYSVDVGYMMDSITGYIRISRFSENTYEEFRVHLNKLLSNNMKNLILDLRQNPGGYLTAATLIADEFIEDDRLLVYTEGRAYKRQEYTARRAGRFEKGNLVVLIDEGSASASEILAGALQDWDRAVIVGRRSFGKGLVQEQYELSDGSALRLTVARYYTPSGRCIQKPYKNTNYTQEGGISEFFNETHSLDDARHMHTTPDTSIKYYTAQKRIVYGGGGIIPDVIVLPDTSYDHIYLYNVRSYVPGFIYHYYADNQLLFTQYKESEYFRKNFTVSEQLYQRFLDYAEKEGLRKDPEKLSKISQLIKTLMKAYLARQMWKDEGYYPVVNTIDPVVAKGYEIVQNPMAYIAAPATQ